MKIKFYKGFIAFFMCYEIYYTYWTFTIHNKIIEYRKNTFKDN